MTSPLPLSKRLLFVDDEASIRATLPLILRSRGFDVEVAASVREAFDAIQQHTFDILLSDLNIAEAGDGYLVVRAVRESNPRCVAIILTGYPAFESAVEGIHHEIDDYIVKPADIDVLVATVERKLASRRQ
jgi:DNA-binding NtrC family response regulator